MKVLLLMGVLLVASVPPSLQAWAQDQGLRVGVTHTRTDCDWSVFDGQFLPVSGKVTVKTVDPRRGGGGNVYSLMRYDFVSPRDTPTAVKLIQTFSQQDVTRALNADKVNTCIRATERMKAPQVKTLLWVKEAGERLLKVNCAVTATGTFVTYEEKVLGDPYWP